MLHIIRRRPNILLLSLISLALVSAVVIWRSETTNAPGVLVFESTQPEANPTPEPEEEEVAPINMQPALESWKSGRSGTAGVVIIDLDANQQVGALNPNERFFAASIYKLYVAYIGYDRVADGTFKLDEPYLNNWTRGKCLDEMIRSSHSPCAEKMRSELGSAYLDQRLKELGLKNTSMSSITTTAADAAIIMQRLFERRDLTSQHADLMLESLEKQIYRDALPAGLPSAKVYNKVGFRDLVEYHDVAIVTLKNGRSFVVSALAKNIGTRGLAALGASLEAAAKDTL